MTILHIMQCTNLGGMEKVAYRAMRDLAEQDGLDFRIATPRPFGPGRRQVLEIDPSARDFPYRGRFGWRDFPAFRRHVRALADRCSHVWVTGTCAASLRAVAGLARPKVLSHHYHHFEGPLSWLKWRAFYELTCRGLDAITYPAAFTRGEAVRIAPWVAEKAVVVPNGFDIHYADEAGHAAARRDARRKLGLSDDAFVVGNGGWLIARKRFDVFLDVAAKIAATMPAAQFVICGDGPLRGALEAQARALGIADRVRFTGWVEDMAMQYRTWDVLLFNSDFDAFGLTCLEATGYGCPVVASVTYGGLPEFIEDGFNGFIFSEHDTQRLAQAVISLARDPRIAEGFRMAGRRVLDTRYSRAASLAFYRQFFGASAGTGQMAPLRAPGK